MAIAFTQNMNFIRIKDFHKSDREGELLYEIPYMWNLKRNDTNELAKQKETDLENKLRVSRGKG